MGKYLKSRFLISIFIITLLLVVYLIPISVKNSDEFKKSYFDLWGYGLISKSCIPISLNRYTVYGNEYTINGENFETWLNSNIYMQMKLNLSTGEIKCNSQEVWVNPGPPRVF